MSRRKQLWGVVVGGLFPVALTWATAGAINIEDPWEIREHQVLITAAIPDCPGPLMDGVLAIHGFYFDEPPCPVSPATPVAPVSPGTPVGPVSPVSPVTP